MLDAVRAAIAGRPTGQPAAAALRLRRTLVAFDPDPDRPRLPPARRKLLAAIAARGDVTVGLISGRPIADLQSRTALAATVYHAGLHGMQIEIEGRRWQHDDIDLARGALRTLKAALYGLKVGQPLVHFEDKGASLAVHFRRVAVGARAAVRRSALAIARPWLEAGELRQRDGSAVVEFLPNIDWDKGRAALWIARDMGSRTGQPAWTVYLGDDRTDEDVFRAITCGIGVRMGHRRTAADFTLGGRSEVDELLTWFVQGHNARSGDERS
ncbi:MAG: trehalose-phosphatase [Acidobacteriota bacterium]